MKTARKQELKGAFKAIVAIAVLGVMIGVGVATTLMSDDGFFVDGNEVLVEGNFTTWTHKWTADLPGGIDSVELMTFHIDEANNILSVHYEDDSATGYNRFATLNLGDASIIFNSSSGVHYTYSAYPESYYSHGGDSVPLVKNFAASQRTYLLLVRNDLENIEVWRQGSQLWTHNVTSEVAGASVYGGGISRTGKYIIAGAYPSSVGQRLVCYEGS